MGVTVVVDTLIDGSRHKLQKPWMIVSDRMMPHGFLVHVKAN